ncbi:hypothetical protein KW798_00180 [Candidatus Parcubacteria bacterium]|nr:hypothetical protein [Candidatus Parcubacteria bacterium]
MRDETINSTALLKEAVDSIRALFPHESVGAVVTRALKDKAGLSDASATEFGVRIERVISRELGGGEPERMQAKRLVEAVEELQSKVTIDNTYDIPALAGYSKDTPTKLYMDRGLKQIFPVASGAQMDVYRYLAVHELVEKCLIDTVPWTSRAYQQSHQLAQRLEQEAVRTEGFSWREYQYTIMVPEIDKAYTKPVRRLPHDLDETPYRDSDDMQILTPQAPMFEPHIISPQIYFLKFKEPGRMASALMRFQEFYESPNFKGKYFTREEFNTWYTEAHKGSHYVQDWGAYGFNFPSAVLKDFYAGHFDPLTQDEQDILDYFAQVSSDFYVIATSPASSNEMIGHEIAHALYFLNSDYKKEVEEILSQVDTEPLEHFLTTHPEYASYHPDVLDDEVHAYLSQTTEELTENGFNVEPYAEATKRLQAVYEKYTKGIVNLPR